MEPLTLGAVEGFYVGGEERAITAGFGPETQALGAMYVQRMAPPEPRGLPVILVHGGLHTGVTWETTPDGREGWQTLLVRAGFDTYVIDQPSRGRSAPDLNCLNPDVTEWGQQPRVSTSGSRLAAQFARGGNRFHRGWYAHYLRQIWPDFFLLHARAAGIPALSDPAALATMVALVDRIGPCILVTHSQGGHLGWQTAIARPEQVRGIYAIEPGILEPGLDDPAFPDIPVTIVWGDGLSDDAPVLSTRDLDLARNYAARRPNITVDHLPDAGIFGNGHMLMMEDNSAELAARAAEWIGAITR